MKILLVIPIVILLISCGESEDQKKSEEWDICKCHIEMDAIEKEMQEKGGSDDLKKRVQVIIGKCDKIQNEMGMEKFMEAREGCLDK